MDRDLSYAYIPDKLISDFGKEGLQKILSSCDIVLDWEHPGYQYSNCVSHMENRLFSFSELKTYAMNCLVKDEFEELEPISMILRLMVDGDFVVINSQ